ncbi:hypothetical protein JOB18_040105 [Solea senegalensis]|uniref:HMG box domain-containing protein n=1 Tax=Solea senegalensis TaxID=28829 RepID=A0AAV6QZU7_SOLSE|nr:hypothetical protein JOB18_040105 [Solea senegalensis]
MAKDKGRETLTMDLLAEVELFEKATVQGEDPLQLMLEALLDETNEPAPVPNVEFDSNSPDLLQDIVKDLSGETEGPVPAVEFDANIPDSFPTMTLEAMLGDTDDRLPVSEDDWDAITPDSLLEKLEALQTETTGQILSIDGFCDPSRTDSIQEILETLLTETTDQILSIDDFCDPSRTDSLQEILEVLLGETSEPIPVAQEPQFDPHSFPSPPTLSTVPAEPVFDTQPQLCKNVPLVPYSQFAQENLVAIGMFNDEVVYALPPQAFSPAFFPTAPPLNTSTSRKRRMSNQKDESGQSYIKKPPNAFMVYRQEQRCKVITELNVRDCAVVNKELGKRWTNLPMQEKVKYYEEADRQRLCHEQLYPKWSPSDNYGKKQKRIRRKGPKPMTVCTAPPL